MSTQVWNWIGYFLLACILVMMLGIIVYEWKWLLWLAVFMVLFYVVLRCRVNVQTGTIECSPIFREVVAEKKSILRKTKKMTTKRK